MPRSAALVHKKAAQLHTRTYHAKQVCTQHTIQRHTPAHTTQTTPTMIDSRDTTTNGGTQRAARCRRLLHRPRSTLMRACNDDNEVYKRRELGATIERILETSEVVMASVIPTCMSMADSASPVRSERPAGYQPARRDTSIHVAGENSTDCDWSASRRCGSKQHRSPLHSPIH